MSYSIRLRLASDLELATVMMPLDARDVAQALSNSYMGKAVLVVNAHNNVELNRYRNGKTVDILIG